MEYQLINPINENYSVLEQVLTNRGIEYNDIHHFLNVTEKDNLSPTFLNNIEKAAQLIIKHIANENGQIYVVIDSDCDGYTSAALLLNYIHARFPSAINKFSYGFHKEKTHGIKLEEIPAGTTLIIAPDSSSNDYSEHELLQQQGIDIVVLDHHQAEKISEYACIVNNQLCDYPTKSLSGVGIVYKLCQYFDSICGDTPLADDYLDIVAVGEVGDMMDTRDFETHYLIQQGLQRSALRNPFIRGMAEKNSYQLGNEDLTPMGVAFYIVPLVNAITRIGTMEEKETLFNSMLEWKAYEQIPSTKRGCKGQKESRLEQALRVCTNVKNRQTRLRDAAAKEIESIIESENLLNHKILLIKLQDIEVDKGIRGLIANELMSKYQRPVALLSQTFHDNQVAWEGSARGYDKSKLKDFRQLLRNSGLIFLAEGHPNAFGIGIYDRNFAPLVEWLDETLKDIEFYPSYKVDFIYNSQTINPQDILTLGDAKTLWGQNIDEPYIVIENLAITKDMLTLMSKDKNPTLKIKLPNGISCIKFKSSEEEFESLYSESGCVHIALIGRAEVNRYYTSVTPQILITDYEIVNKQQWYF